MVIAVLLIRKPRRFVEASAGVDKNGAFAAAADGRLAGVDQAAVVTTRERNKSIRCGAMLFRFVSLVYWRSSSSKWEMDDVDVSR